MDNLSESTESSLDVNEAAKLFAAMDEPAPEAEEPKKEPKPAAKTEAEPEPESEAEENAAEEGDDAPLTIEVDGKQVTLTKAEIAEAYKSGLRQADYTQKTMAVAEERKAAEAEAQKAQQERMTYAQNLQKMAAQLEGVLEQQNNIDWNALLEQNPVEFMRQQHLFNQRQAAYAQNQREQSALLEKAKAEQAKEHSSYIQRQQQDLLAKLPEWKDEAKAKAESDSIKIYLKEQGYGDDDVKNITDHRAVLIARDAMRYRALVAKAQAAEKKVANVPTKVERSGVSSSDRDSSGKQAAMRQLARTNSVEDAARVFGTIFQ